MNMEMMVEMIINDDYCDDYNYDDNSPPAAYTNGISIMPRTMMKVMVVKMMMIGTFLCGKLRNLQQKSFHLAPKST